MGLFARWLSGSRRPEAGAAALRQTISENIKAQKASVHSAAGVTMAAGDLKGRLDGTILTIQARTRRADDPLRATLNDVLNKVRPQ